MKIEILIYDGMDDLDAFGPFEVLRGARIDTTFVTVAPADVVTTSGGARLVPHGVVGDPDLVLVPGGGWNDKGGAYQQAQLGTIPAFFKARHAAGRRCGSICTGAMLLAEAGILDGRRATTHHTSHEQLKTYGVDVIEDARYVDEGDIITAGGVSSGIDMALHLVREIRGEKVAEAVAAEIEWTTQISAASTAG